MNYMSPFTLNDTLIADCSYQTSSVRRSEDSWKSTGENPYKYLKEVGYYPPCLLTFCEEPIEENPTKNNLRRSFEKSVPKNNFSDVPIFLQTLMNDIANLEKEVKQKSSDAMKMNMERTLIVLTMHNIFLKIRMKTTLEELGSVANKNYKYKESPTRLQRNNVRVKPDPKNSTAKLVVEIVHKDRGINMPSLQLAEKQNQQIEKNVQPVVHNNTAKIVPQVKNNMKEIKMPKSLLLSQVNHQQIRKRVPYFDCEQTAKNWLQNLLQSAEYKNNSSMKRLELGSKDNVKKILFAMKDFPDNEEIENSACDIVANLSAWAYSIRSFGSSG